MALRLDELNRPQRQAVTHRDGPLLVLAGAGSGKTRVITYRVAWLLEQGVPAESILAVSFTNKAATEMRERVDRLVGAAAKRVTLSTFHSLGLSILKKEREALGFPTGFTIYDQADQLGVVRECLRQVQLDDRRFDPKAILHRISRAKNAFLTPADYPAGDHEYEQITREIFPRYQAAMNAFHAVDFDDLIVATARLLQRETAVRERWQGRFRYLMVDEYQDTNRTQFVLLEQLVALHKNLVVVGDDDQSIYAFRGAEAGHILDFERHFPGARMVKLEENYRSTQPILEAANAVIANNRKRHDKRLFTARPGGEKLQLVVAADGDHEAQFVAEEIDLLCHRRGYRPQQCAVLYRSNVQVRPFEEALRAQRLPYRVVGGQSFYERKEVKDAMAYLKAALQPRDEIALRRIVNYPARGIGETTLERLGERAKERKMPLFEVLRHADLVEGLTAKARESIRGFLALLDAHRPALQRGHDLATAARAICEAARIRDDLIAAAVSQTAGQRRIDNLEGFFNAVAAWEQRSRAARGHADLLAYLQALTLASSDDDDDEGDETDRVTLTTLHGAKGLEWKVVFLVGLEEELIPHQRILYPQGHDVVDEALDLSEERRLLYVGITRAREILYLTRCRQRLARAAQRERTPSRFLDEIPGAICVARDLEMPALKNAEDEEAFARDCLAKLRALTG